MARTLGTVGTVGRRQQQQQQQPLRWHGGTEGLLCVCVSCGGRNSVLDMNGKAVRREPESGTGTATTATTTTTSSNSISSGVTTNGTNGTNANANAGHGNANGNNIAMVTDSQPETPQPSLPHSRVSNAIITVIITY